MAPKRKYRRSSGLDKVVVGFLFFFVFVSFALALGVYAGFNGQAAADAKARGEASKRKALEKEKKFAELGHLEARAAFGSPLQEDQNLDERNNWWLARNDLLEGKFDGMAGADKLKEFVRLNERYLGKPQVIVPKDKNAAVDRYKYPTTWAARLGLLQKQIAELQAQTKNLSEDNAAWKKKYNVVFTKYEGWKQDVIKQAKQDNANALDSAKKQNAALDLLLKENAALKGERQQLQTAMLEQERKYKNINDELVQEIDRLRNQQNGNKKGQQPGQQARPSGGRWHALMLDISNGRPLWDRPKGKILKVDMKNLKVYIDRGSASGIKQQMTFNIFAADDGAAYGSLKGTIEVLDALDAHTSVASITSLFTSDGREIPLLDPRRGAAQRLADNPIRKGDLLYNMFWHTHVALAGHFNLSGNPAFTAQDRRRHMDQVMTLLDRQGIVVDAFLDPTDAKIKGKIKPETQYLILGHDSFGVKKEVVNAGGPSRQEFDDGIAKLFNEAKEKGLFIISAENFANVAGFRNPHSADSRKVGSFRPRPPYAGGTTVIGGGPAPAMKKGY